MAWRRLRRTSQARLAGFELPVPFSVKALCEQISRSRNRKLHLHPLPFAASPDLPCGVWIALDDSDHVFYANGASALHQQNIILHELGHLLCDHQTDAALFGDLDPEVVRRILMRTRYSTPQEEEAEMVAALILERAGWAAPEPPPTEALGNLAAVFDVDRRS